MAEKSKKSKKCKRCKGSGWVLKGVVAVYCRDCLGGLKTDD